VNVVCWQRKWKAAWNAGFEAADRGEPVGSNPMLGVERSYWHEGYLTASDNPMIERKTKGDRYVAESERPDFW
jgi:hypothetical protein